MPRLPVLSAVPRQHAIQATPYALSRNEAQERRADETPARKCELAEGEHEACVRVALVDKIVHREGSDARLCRTSFEGGHHNSASQNGGDSQRGTR